MPVRRGDKYEGRLKIAGKVVQTKRFPTKKAAKDWEDRRRLAFADSGYNPAHGKVSVGDLVTEWLSLRVDRVSTTTLNTDGFLLPRVDENGTLHERALTLWMLKLNVNAVSSAHIEKWQSDLLSRDLAPTSVRRYRESFSAFWTWAVREHYVPSNPVKNARPPKDNRPKDRIRPLPMPEFRDVVARVRAIDQRHGDIVQVLGMTGLRWGELRAMRVLDYIQVPTPLLLVRRNQPEGAAVRTTKSGVSRKLPLTTEIVTIVERLARDKRPSDLLFTTASGSQLHRSAFIRKSKWSINGDARSLHDLRHTSACLWLASGVSLGTVRAWMGHANITMTSRYLMHVGDHADRSALDLLNASWGDSGVTKDREEDAG